MSVRDVGDRMNLEHLVYDPFTDPPTLINATVSLAVTDPAGAVTNPSVTNSSTGTYRASFTITSAGTWYWRWSVSGAVVDVADGQVTAQDVGPPSYATLDQLKSARKMTATDRDEDLTQVLLAASRQIDDLYAGNRQFWLDKTVSQRQFRTVGNTYCTSDGEWLLIDDIGNTTGLIVETGDGTSWATVTDYQTGPPNAIAKRKPVTQLLRVNGYWGNGLNSQVRVTARWGWPAIPDGVVRACLILANRLYLRKDSPEGVLGNAEWGVARVAKTDPDVEALVSPHARYGVG